MIRKFKNISIIILLSFLVFNSCDKGIEPLPEKTDDVISGFSGKINFIGTWPDSVRQTYLVVFQNPIQTDEDFLPPNLSFFIGPIPFGSQEFSYNSIEFSTVQLAPGDYKYVVVAQTTKPQLSFLRDDWTVAGIYYENNASTNPGILRIREDQFLENINIECDFNNPPVQPPSANGLNNEQN